MNLIFGKLVKLVGIEKLFLMAWNYFLPVLMEQAKKTSYQWDEKTLLFVNDLILIFTGKKKPDEGDAHPDVSKPQALIDLEKKLEEKR